MQISHQSQWLNSQVISGLNSFLIWTLTLTVCFLVVGFPLVVILMTVGVLAAFVLQSVFPASAIVLVAGTMFSVTVMGIILGSIMLTLKGINPNEVKWLGWLQDNKTAHKPMYASCPLTCNINKL